MVGRSPRCVRLHAAEAEPGEIKLTDKDFDHADRIVFVHILIHPLRKQSALIAILAHHKACHQIPPAKLTGES